MHFTHGHEPGGPIPDDIPQLDGWLDTVTIPLCPRVAKLFGTDQPFTVLLRPDNYIATLWKGHTTAPLCEWLVGKLGISSPAAE